MHPVAQHLLQRKNKSIPIDDGKKIALVLYGGIMRGIRGAAALVALEEMGLRQAFDEVYAFSVGSVNAAYYLSGQISQGLVHYYNDSVGGKFIQNGLILKKLDLDLFIDIFRNTGHLNVGKIFQQNTKFFVRVVDYQTKQKEYIEAHELDHENFLNLLEASILPPLFGHGPVRIGDKMYTDTNVFPYLNEYLDHIIASDATDIVVVYNSVYQRQRNYDDDPRILEIRVGKKWKLSRFEDNPDKLISSALEMGGNVKKIFGEKGEIQIF